MSDSAKTSYTVQEIAEEVAKRAEETLLNRIDENRERDLLRKIEALVISGEALKEENKRLKDGLKAFVESFEADNVLWIAGSYEKAKLLLKEE